MSDSKNQRQSVLMRSSLRLDEKEDLFGLITAEMHAELPDSAIRLRIYPTTHKTKKTRMILCEALGSWPAPTEVVSVLRTIANGDFPVSAVKKLQQKATKYRCPKLSMSMEEMPDTFRSFCREVDGTLSRAIQRFVGVLRWRIGMLNAFPLWAHGSGEFSVDEGVVWHWLPHDMSVKARVGKGVPRLSVPQ